MRAGPERHIDYSRILADVRSRRVEPRSVVISAIVAGLVFLAIELLGRELAHDTSALTTPVRIASLLLGEAVIRHSAPAGLLALALILHAMLSLVYAMIICLAVQHVPIRAALLLGAVFGAVIYFVNHHALTPVFPAFAAARGGIALVAHVAFGVSAVGTFAVLRRRARHVRAPTEEAHARP